MADFSKELKEARLAANLTQQGMADLTLVPRRTIQEWEAGTRNPPEYVKRWVLAELKEIMNEL